MIFTLFLQRYKQIYSCETVSLRPKKTLLIWDICEIFKQKGHEKG
jgi:hypothetical protein